MELLWLILNTFDHNREMQGKARAISIEALYLSAIEL
jgi:hypothetical protein